MFGVLIRPPKQPYWEKPTSSSKIMKTLGVPGFGFTCSGYHSCDSAYVFPILPLNSWPYLAKESSFDGEGSAARSGRAEPARPNDAIMIKRRQTDKLDVMFLIIFW